MRIIQLFFITPFIILLNPANAQDGAAASPFSAIRNTDRQVRTVISTAGNYEANKKDNRQVVSTASQGAAIDGQKEVEAELGRYNAVIRGIGQFRKDLNNLDQQIALINNGITSLKVVNPSSDYLGTSFAEVLTKNAIDILGSDVGNGAQKSKFQKIIAMLVSNPLVAGILKFTPVTSLAKDAVTSAITVSEGKIQQSTIDRFNKTISPYLEFYSSIDDAADKLQEDLSSISISITKKLSRLKRLEQAIHELLDNYPGKNNQDRLKSMLQLNKYPKPGPQQVREMLANPDVRSLNQLVDRQLLLADDFIDDPVALQVSYNSYIDKMKTILTNAKSAAGLKFDTGKIEEAILQYRSI
ncbi:MAG: hypothetical protein EOO09_02485 [Chitinophagaceae bacterium]|nr:MAG: hypothetical protein EOO09_02485 [Chitinophagaceae bacterium]